MLSHKTWMLSEDFLLTSSEIVLGATLQNGGSIIQFFLGVLLSSEIGQTKKQGELKNVLVSKFENEQVLHSNSKGVLHWEFSKSQPVSASEAFFHPACFLEILERRPQEVEYQPQITLQICRRINIGNQSLETSTWLPHPAASSCLFYLKKIFFFFLANMVFIPSNPSSSRILLRKCLFYF